MVKLSLFRNPVPPGPQNRGFENHTKSRSQIDIYYIYVHNAMRIHTERSCCGVFVCVIYVYLPAMRTDLHSARGLQSSASTSRRRDGGWA